MLLKKCRNGHYTLKEVCRCGLPAKTAHPPKYSEKFGKYRRLAKKKSGKA
jgi:rRNA maturation protein Nop10